MIARRTEPRFRTVLPQLFFPSLLRCSVEWFYCIILVRADYSVPSCPCVAERKELNMFWPAAQRDVPDVILAKATVVFASLVPNVLLAL